jgi:hypothetical protein
MAQHTQTMARRPEHARLHARRAARRRMVCGAAYALAALLLACGGLSLAACGGPSGAAPTPTTTPQPTAAATATPAVLYQADWSRGLAGWNATPGWSIMDGALQSDTGDNRSVTIPYQPAASNYAVEFQLQIVTIPQTGGYFVLSADQAPGRAGYFAGVHSLRAGAQQYADHPNISIYTDPLDDEDPNAASLAVHDYEPGSASRTYRVAVTGSAAVFTVDGHTWSTAVSTQTPQLSSGPLHLTCSGVAIRISAVRITGP